MCEIILCVRHVSNSPITHRKSYFESLIRPSEKRLLEQGFSTFFFSVKFPSCTVPNTRHSLAVLTFKRLYSLAIGDSVISFRIFFLEVRPDYFTFLSPFEEFISIFEFVFSIEGSFFPLKIFPLRKIDDRKESHFTDFHFQLHHDAEKTREEILSLIAHHVTAVNYIYRDTRFDGRIKHRNIKFEVQRIKVI